MRKLMVLISVFLINYLFGGPVSASSLEGIIEDIENARSADDLYTARMNLKRLARPSDPTLNELELWQEAYYHLATGFKNRNHYRNGVIVFYQYLDLKERYLEIKTQNSLDSIIAVNSRLETQESRTISQLTNELNDLNDNRSKVIELRNSYSKYGTFGSGLIIVIFTYLIYMRQRKIKELRKGLSENREHVLRSSEKLVESSLLNATHVMISKVSKRTANLIGRILSEENVKINAEDKSSLENLKKGFEVNS